VSFSGERYRGFRHHSDGQRKSVQANAGWRGAGGLQSRLWLGWTDLGYHIAGPLPPGRAYGDPSQVLGDGNTPRDRLLDRYGDMLQGLSYQAEAGSVRVGFDQSYATFHEFGVEFGTRRMPRRSLLMAAPEAGTLAPDDERAVIDVLGDFLFQE